MNLWTRTSRDRFVPPRGPSGAGADLASTPKATFALLGVIAVVFMAATLAGGTEEPEVLDTFGALNGARIAAGDYWRLLTAVFLHLGWTHLGVNAISLFIFGQLVERWYGHARFVALYLLSGLTGSAASYLFTLTHEAAWGAGASGAIFGVVGALAAHLVKQRRLIGKQARGSLAGVAVVVGVNFTMGLTTDGIDNWAHLGGLVGGFLVGLALSPELMVVQTPLGHKALISVARPPLRTWWIVPVALAAVVGAAAIGTIRWEDSPYALYRQAVGSFERDEVVEALDAVNQALELEARHPESRLLRGKIWLLQGRNDRALADLAVAVRSPNREVREEALTLLVSARRR